MSQNDIETNAENYEMEDGPFRKKPSPNMILQVKN